MSDFFVRIIFFALKTEFNINLKMSKSPCFSLCALSRQPASV